jgi:hypothetical protein
MNIILVSKFERIISRIENGKFEDRLISHNGLLNKKKVCPWKTFKPYFKTKT